MRSSQASGLQQVRFLCDQHSDHVAIPVFVLAPVVITKLPHRLHKRTSRLEARLRMILLEQSPEKPRQRRMDTVVPAAKRRQQPDFRRPVQQCDPRLASETLQLRQATVCLRMPHSAQHIDIHKSLKKMQQRKLLPLRLRKRIFKPVRE